MPLEGLAVPTATLFTEDGEIDLSKNARFTRGLLDQGILHVFALGSLGEFPSLTFEERETFLETVVESSTFHSDVWAGVGAPSTKKAVAHADQAESLGAAVLVATPPFYLHPDAGGIRDYYRTLRKQTKLPLLAYNIPSLVGYALPPSLVHELAREGTLQGIKDTSGSLSSVRSFLEGAPEGFAVFPGDDELALDSLRAGARGAIMGLGNILPKLTVAFMNAARAEKWGEAESLQKLIATLRQVVQKGPFPSTVKFLMNRLRGVEVGYRSPYLPLTPEQEKAVVDALTPVEASFKSYL